MLDIEPELLEYVEPLREGLIKEIKSYVNLSDKWLSEEETEETFAEGARVKHPIFGPGTIQEVDVSKKAYLVQFDEMETPRAISFKVRLESGE